MGPFPMAMWQLKFLVVEIDYFTKWVEAEPLATIMEKNVQSFIWKSIISHFGILESLPRTMAKNLTTMHSETSATVRDQKPLFITYPPISQWLGRSCKPILTQDVQDLALGGKGDIVRRTTECIMGISNDDSHTYRQNTFSPCI